MKKARRRVFITSSFDIFGVERRSVARYEEHVRRLDNTHGYIDLFWPRVLIVEQKSAGRDLDESLRTGGGILRRPPRKRKTRPHSGERLPDV